MPSTARTLSAAAGPMPPTARILTAAAKMPALSKPATAKTLVAAARALARSVSFTARISPAVVARMRKLLWSVAWRLDRAPLLVAVRQPLGL